MLLLITIVSIMSTPTNEVKERLEQFWKQNLAFRKTIAKRQKELDASLNVRRTRFVPASPSTGISGSACRTVG
jgi:response regulator of citrate/malate metabolism